MSLRALARGDLPLFRSLYCDAGTMRHIGRPFSRARADAGFRATLAACRRVAGLRFYVIGEGRDGQAAGLCSIRPAGDDDCREVGVMLLRSARGRGLAEAALRKLIDSAFRTLPIAAVSVQYRNANAAMSRLCDRLGFAAAGATPSSGRSKACARVLRRRQWHRRIHQPAKGKAMSRIIGFLEQAGRDAALRHATRDQLLRRMNEEGIGQALQEAVLQPRQPKLAGLIGARETMYAQNQSIKPPKKKAPAKKTPAKKKAPAKKPAKKAPAKRKK